MVHSNKGSIFATSNKKNKNMEKNSDMVGKKIKIVHMDDKLSGDKYNGKVGVVTYVDSMGQLHGTWGGLAVIPECDTFVVLGDEKNG